MRTLLLIVLAGCTASEEDVETPMVPVLEGFREIVPAAMPADLALQPANNNLDITVHEGRYWLAFRTAPTHFASADTEMVVVSSEDEVDWRVEDVLSMGRDLREPHLISTGGELYLHYAMLGTSPIDFEPGGSVRARWEGDGFGEPEPFGPEGFIPWRIKPLSDGRWHLFGYTGGGEVYDNDGDPVRIHWYTSDDAVDWEPAVGDDPVVQEGGGSETDAVFLDDGSLVAVVRNEAGDDTGFGSKVCTAPADDLGNWTCASDPRKYDSPLLLKSPGGVWLVGRRNVTDDGHYDLGRDDLAPADRYLAYQADYWGRPKRCALWSVDPATRTVDHVLDLPSKGDTCFPEAIETEAGWLLYNYSSNPDGPDVSWLEGQQGRTFIHRMVLSLP
jgi:hypothetical protein